MKRKIVVGILIIICFLLQCTLFKALALGAVSPNLLIVLTSCFGFMRGKKEGLFVGFFCGLLIDIFYGDVIGFYSLLYMYIGYGNGFFHKLFFDDDVKLPMFLICASDLLQGFIIYLFLFLLRTKWDIIYYFMNIIIPELVYTVLVTIIFYRIIRKVNRILEEDEKRSAAKFV